MNNDIQNVHKNARYKVLNVGGEYYILDMEFFLAFNFTVPELVYFI